MSALRHGPGLPIHFQLFKHIHPTPCLLPRQSPRQAILRPITGLVCCIKMKTMLTPQAQESLIERGRPAKINHRICGRNLMIGLASRCMAVLAFALLVASTGLVQADDLIPARRLALSENTDLQGGDLSSIFDTTLSACETACLVNASCDAMTFNTKNGSCFLKQGAGDPVEFDGAYSGYVMQADPGAEDLARTRRADLTFLQDWDISSATSLAADMDNRHVTNGYTAEDHLASAADAEANGDFAAAFRYTGAALNVSDTPENWSEYARLLSLAADGDQGNASLWRDEAFQATINAYLRADDPGLQHTILVQMAQAMERLSRGRDMVQALRLAQSLQARDDTATLLDDAASKFGFRVLDHEMQTETIRPRVCVRFSEDLLSFGVDYASFVKLPDAGMSVALDGPRQLCVEGIAYGTRYKLTFRKGLPAATGETLTRSVEIAAYVRDRAPSVHFGSRGYVLPRIGSASIPVVTVNMTTLNLEVWKVTDRNLLRALQDGYFNQPMYFYQEEDFETKLATKLWSGTAIVGSDMNQDITTRLPMDAAIAGQPSGIYALRAIAPGAGEYDDASWQWFVVSDLGLTTMDGADGLHVFVHSLGNAQPKPGVKVQLLSSANDVLATATTDAVGHALFEAGLVRGMGSAAPAMIVVQDGGDDQAFLSLTDPEFDLSDRGVEGAEAPPPVDVFLSTDRGAYRVNETVHATALTRDAKQAAIVGLPLTAILTRPDGVEYTRALADDAGAGGHVFDFPLSETAPRGRWGLSVYADLDAPALQSTSFLVEDFLPERIDVAVGLDDATLMLGDVAQLSVDAKYLFGAPAADLAVEGEVILRARDGLASWPGYSFGRFDVGFDSQTSAFGGERTDGAGHALIHAGLPEVKDPMRPLEAVFVTRVSEGSGRPVERKVTKPVAPSAAMIGVKPMFDGVVAEGSQARFNLVGVGTDATATPMQVHWTMTRIDTNYQWYQIHGEWDWQAVTNRTRVAEGDADLTANGPVEIAAPVTWGEYELSVARSDGTDAVTSVKFYAGWYAPADVTSTPDTLQVSLDRPSYAVGDTAKLRIVPKAAGTALVTVLSNTVVSHFEVTVTAGENLIAVPVTDDWGTGVYVTAVVLRPMDVAGGRNPTRALGLAYAKIDPGTRALTTVIETAAEAAPRGPMDIAVKVAGVAPGDTAYVTVAAVDVGILNLTGTVPPDPQGHYFGQRKLGVGIRDLYGRLIDGMNGALGEVRSGGDAGANARLQAPPPTEKLVANFAGPIQVDSDGYARVSFDLPAFNGTVKVMAVAWSARGVGQASADVLVRDPVVVTASLPRFMQPGDQSRLRLEIVHATGPSGRMGLNVTSTGLLLGDAPDAVTLADKGTAVVEVPLTADALGLQTVEVTLTTPDGKILTKDLTLPVQVNDPMIAHVSRFDLAKGQNFTLDDTVFAGLMPASAKAVMAIGPIGRLNAPGVMAALDAYPYGCTEQITSKAMPLLYFDQVAQALDLPGAHDIKGRVTQAIAAVLANQDSSGAFGLWRPGSGDMWLDAYVTDFLSRAKAVGYDVPAPAFRQALDNLRNQVNYYADFDTGGEPLAYALMVLAREGAAAIGDLRYYVDVKADTFATPTAMAQLGAAMASYGDQPRADKMFGKAVALLDGLPTREDQTLRADYGTHRRDAAVVLALGVEAGSKVIDQQALVDRIATEGVLSTQEATWSLLATHAMIRSDELAISFDGEPAAGPLVKVLDANQPDPVLVGNVGRDTSVTLTTFGVPTDPVTAGGNGYAISRTAYTLDGEPATWDGAKVGQRLLVVLEVTPFGRGEARLMVTDPLPAGYEIDNPNLMLAGAVPALDFLNLTTEATHSEFRQDRFVAAVDRKENGSFRLAYIVRAVSPGTYHHAAASVEDMYRPDLTAHTDAGAVTITP